MEYALIIDNVFSGLQFHKERPADIEHKKLRWLPVSRREGADFIGEEQGEWVISVKPAIPEVPQSVTMAQARLALRRAGLFDIIQGGLEALPEPQRTEALEAWEYSPYISRDGEFVNNLAKKFGIASSTLDELFTQAAQIKL